MKTVTRAITECWPRFSTLPDGITEAEWGAIRAGESVELSDDVADVLIERGFVKEQGA